MALMMEIGTAAIRITRMSQIAMDQPARRPLGPRKTIFRMRVSGGSGAAGAGMSSSGAAASGASAGVGGRFISGSIWTPLSGWLESDFS